MTESQIKEALIALLDGIKRADAAIISTQTAALDDAVERGRGAYPAQLVHFLQNRSYAKALLYLGGASDIPRGNCGGRA